LAEDVVVVVVVVRINEPGRGRGVVIGIPRDMLLEAAGVVGLVRSEAGEPGREGVAWTAAEGVGVYALPSTVLADCNPYETSGGDNGEDIK